MASNIRRSYFNLYISNIKLKSRKQKYRVGYFNVTLLYNVYDTYIHVPMQRILHDTCRIVKCGWFWWNFCESISWTHLSPKEIVGHVQQKFEKLFLSKSCMVRWEFDRPTYFFANLTCCLNDEEIQYCYLLRLSISQHPRSLHCYMFFLCLNRFSFHSTKCQFYSFPLQVATFSSPTAVTNFSGISLEEEAISHLGKNVKIYSLNSSFNIVSLRL